jgi:hypothetical protein
VEQELAAGLGEGQIAEFIENDEVHAGQVFGKAALPGVAGLGLEPIDEIDHVVEPAAGAGSNAASGNRKTSAGNRSLPLNSDGRYLLNCRTRSSGAHSLFKRVEIAMEIGNVSRRLELAEMYCLPAGAKVPVLIDGMVARPTGLTLTTDGKTYRPSAWTSIR